MEIIKESLMKEYAMHYFKKIPGKRVYLSPINPDDAVQYTHWVNDLVVSANLGTASNVYSLPAEKAFLENMSKSGHNYAIVHSADNTLLGNCSLMEINPHFRTATLGIFIGDEDNRGKGYGNEAISLLVEYGFKVLNLNNIMLKLFSFNRAAFKCYEKVGFREFGRRSRSCFINGRYFDEIYMEIFPENLKAHYLNDCLPGSEESV